MNTKELSPVEQHGDVFYKREDMFTPFGSDHVNGSKVRLALYQINKHLAKIEAFHKSTVMAQTSVHSTTGTILAKIAQHFNLKCIICLGASKPKTIPKHRMILLARDVYGAEIRNVSGVGYAQVIEKKLKEICQQEGYYNSCYNPGFLHIISHQVENLPDNLENLVIPVGAGIQMAGIVEGLHLHGKKVKRVIGVHVGPDRTKQIHSMLSFAYPFEMVNLKTPYSKEEKVQIKPGFDLDPTYEAKAWNWMTQSLDLKNEKTAFWVVGRKLSWDNINNLLKPNK
jgi:1-aminocyclopropane-1-carboxylate deaminase/D-cysteine desulfhydrase-like pyridoxal-dependent ACC family enzyme